MRQLLERDIINLVTKYPKKIAIQSDGQNLQIKPEYSLNLKIQKEGSFGAYFWGITIDKNDKKDILRGIKQMKVLENDIKKILDL